jgi:phenylalanyl-tRNA synthetase alpha chain
MQTLSSTTTRATTTACSSSQHVRLLSTNGTEISLLGHSLNHEDCNVTSNIASRVGTNLHLQDKHPLFTIKRIIEQYWLAQDANFKTVDDLQPVVSTDANFDSLLIPPDHISRSKSDTYYLNQDVVLRTHTSAHQVDLLKQGIDKFLVTGDVYRRDEIDRSHYPIFHQMEGVKMSDDSELLDGTNDIAQVEQDLKRGLEGLAKTLFGDVQMRWVDAYFPFTEPSFELEIYFNDEWLEVLGCGVIQKEIVRNSGRGDQIGWAFGLGLERLAMVLFDIPDIRLFWTNDPRFHKQFESGEIVKFVPFSKYPPCLKDISFWVPDAFHANDLNEVVRDVAGDLVEQVELIDDFVHPKTQKQSNCFRITYRSMERSLTNEEIDALQEQVRECVVGQLGAELR